jgi:predicted NBD/HSP70 family sugar kinase
MPYLLPGHAETTAVHGSNAERSRAYNRSLVLGHVRASGGSGRAEIARASGLSTQAVSNIIGDLVADGWLREAGRRSEGRGLPAVQYTIDPKAGVALGVEVRPGAVLTALIGLDGQTLFTNRVAIERADPGTLERVLPELKDQALASCNAVAAGRLLGAGVVMPGPFGATGLSGAASDLPGWADLDPQALFSNWLGQPVTIENDANASAMMERVLGVAQDIASYAYIYFGTGLGLGIVSGGAIQRGAMGNAGEIGHIPVPLAEGFLPLEQTVSRMAIRTRMAQAGERADVIEDLEVLYDKRHPALLDWIDEAAPALCHALHIVENLLDPQTIILGGALPKDLLDELLQHIALSDRSVANRPRRDLPRLMCGACGRMTATHGAAALVLNQALTPRMAATA